MKTVESATNEVLTRHLKAFGESSIEKILSDYSEQSTILCGKGAIKGLDNIRQFFEEMFGLIPAGSLFEMKKLTVSGNSAHIIWSSKSATADIPFGTDTFIIENNKITLHTVSAFIK